MDEYKVLEECCFSPAFCSRNMDELEPLFIGCVCKGSCVGEYERDEDCICSAQHDLAYDSKRRLKNVQSDEPIYECNDCCSCPVTICANRVVQQKATRPWSLEVFTTIDKGRGLRTNHDIPMGSFVIEYVGEVVTREEAVFKMAEIIDNNHNCYVFITKEHYAGSSNSSIKRCKYFCIDASTRGNEARFINHSCEPNLAPIPVRINSRFPHVALFANRDIRLGEELTFSYGAGDVNDIKNSDNESDKLKKCYCGSNGCRGYLPFDRSCFDE